jgi:hypothetical protein
MILKNNYCFYVDYELFRVFMPFPEVVPRKSPAKILPFFLIGVILLRNYRSHVQKNLFRDAKTAKKMAKASVFFAFGWQNADSFTKMVTKTQVTICYNSNNYSNT